MARGGPLALTRGHYTTNQPLGSLGDSPPQLRGLEHFGLIAIAQNPPRDLVQASHGDAKVQVPSRQELQRLGLVPNDSATLRATSGRKRDHFLIGPGSGIRCQALPK